jgi:hypothetical protein
VGRVKQVRATMECYSDLQSTRFVRFIYYKNIDMQGKANMQTDGVG